ncbi:mitochondrial fission ELM1 family protein [Roseomonas sp. SSH11]|uniref:Mitochondrial fission ELM1 family protein n=1 Tax=Pararoseomonas baculiformis TaxID=2820812 RepID=A0ABS4AGZ3_9PROT|nr:mitochondrial fission ELM1 family protein [Pararoseomonas baculiformis]MBP0446293.1 mitochondrial fission ELM1 family protein [Pararoseomonas baculiformis]
MSGPGGIWVLADPRAGTAAQALGIAERLGQPFRTLPLEWGPLAALPWPWPGLAGLSPAARGRIAAPWPGLVISAGRRSVPVARWLGRRGARLVHCMRPGAGAGEFGLLVVGRHDNPRPAPNVMPILGATHRISPAVLDAARRDWAALLALPRPRVAVMLGGAVRGQGMPPEEALEILDRVLPHAGSVLATTSRRTGEAAAEALAGRLAGVPGMLHRWGSAGPNPYAGFLAAADSVVVTGDSVSMLSEALASPASVFVAGAPPDAPRHRALHQALFQAGQAVPFGNFPAAPPRVPLDETGRVAEAVRARLQAGEAALVSAARG